MPRRILDQPAGAASRDGDDARGRRGDRAKLERAPPCSFHRRRITRSRGHVQRCAGAPGSVAGARAAIHERRVARIAYARLVDPSDGGAGAPAARFNDVVARVWASLGRVLQLTSDASHELRTRVSLNQATAEVALRWTR